MPPKKRTPTKVSLVTPEAAIAATPDPEAIAARAYFLYLERGGAHGNDWDDWLRAERDLTTSADR